MIDRKSFNQFANGLHLLDKNPKFAMPKITFNDKYIDKTKVNLFRNVEKYKWVGQSSFNPFVKSHRNLFKLNN